MTTAEHLNAIKAKCHELLAIAEKRTPGKWEHSPNYLIGGWWVQDSLAKEREGSVADFCKEEDAAFIAAAAGPFEASLRSTIAAIEALLEIYDNPDETVAREIIAAWPLELL